MKNLISIIVPVYNVEQYLEKCLNSLINQTYKNIEIICINDESIDNSLVILNQYAIKDERIKIVDQKNNGVSGARNKGIEVSSGEFILFVDADDWIDIETCEVALKTTLENNADVVFWSYVKEYGYKSQKKILFNYDFICFTESKVKSRLHRRICGLTGVELKKPENSDAIATVWGKIYRSKIIKRNSIKFVDLDKIGSAEDVLFNFYYFNFVRKAIYLNKYFCHYRKDNQDSLTSKYRTNLFEQWHNLFNMFEENIKKANLDIRFTEALNNRIALSIIGLGLNELSSDTTSIKKIIAIRNIINTDKMKHAFNNLELKYFPLHWKLFFFLAKYRNYLGLYMLLMIISKIIGR